jgi:hypothetical protein
MTECWGLARGYHAKATVDATLTYTAHKAIKYSSSVHCVLNVVSSSEFRVTSGIVKYVVELVQDKLQHTRMNSGPVVGPFAFDAHFQDLCP